MSVIVKGMKMPDNCSMCDMMVGTFCQILNIDVDPFYDGATSRNKKCPLVELPEKHGRLIEEKEIRTVMNWLLTQPQRPMWNDLYHAIQEMKAIIEAEGAEE